MKILSFVVVLVTLFVMLVAPVISLITFGFDSDILLSTSTLGILRFTIFQAVVSTLLSVAAGLPLGLWASRISNRQNGRIYLLLAAPFAVPSLVAAVSWIHLFGRTGILYGLGWGFSLKALVTAHFAFNAPWIALQIAMARDQIPAAEVESAKSLGANLFERARFVLWPRLKWTILSASSQVFSFCAMSFALVLLLGGGPPLETLETSIYSSIRVSGFDLRTAISFSLWQMLLNLIPWIFILWARRKVKNVSVEIATRKFSLSRTERGAFIFTAFLFLCPYFPSLFHIRISVLEIPGLKAATMTSLQLALATSFISVLLASAWIYSLRSTSSSTLKTFLEITANLPTSFSIFVFGLGFYLAYSKWVNPFDGSLIAIVALQAFLFFPIAFRWLWPIALGSQRSAFEVAMSLGASPLRAFIIVEWPRWKRPLLLVAALIAGISVGEIGAVSLFYSEQLIPLPLVISRLTAQYRFEEAQALSGILLLISISPFLALGWLPKNQRRFID